MQSSNNYSFMSYRRLLDARGEVSRLLCVRVRRKGCIIAGRVFRRVIPTVRTQNSKCGSGGACVRGAHGLLQIPYSTRVFDRKNKVDFLIRPRENILFFEMLNFRKWTRSPTTTRRPDNERNHHRRTAYLMAWQ